MLIKEHMSHPVITVDQNMPIQEALDLMKREGISRTPVMNKDKMIGIISVYDLLNASPSQATSLSIFELNYLLSKITVKEVMTRDVISVDVETPLEEAARIMADSKIGGLPVLEKGNLVGIITETDLFMVLLELLGAREAGVRLTVMLKDQPGELAKLVAEIAAGKGNIIAMGEMHGRDPGTREIMLKVAGIKESEMKKIAEKVQAEIKDLRSNS